MDSVSTFNVSSFRPALLNRLASTAAIGAPSTFTPGPMDGSNLTPGARIAAASERLNERWLSTATNDEKKPEDVRKSDETDKKEEAIASTEEGQPQDEGDAMMSNIDKLRRQASSWAN